MIYKNAKTVEIMKILKQNYRQSQILHISAERSFKTWLRWRSNDLKSVKRECFHDMFVISTIIGHYLT